MTSRGNVENKGSENRDFTLMLNFVYKIGLSIYDRDLYNFYRMAAGEHGKCWMAFGTIAEQTGMSSAQISISRKRLEEKKLITCTLRKHGQAGWPTWHIAINDMWDENIRICKEDYQRRAAEAMKSSLCEGFTEDVIEQGEPNRLHSKQIRLQGKQSRLQDGVQIRCKDVNTCTENTQEHAYSGGEQSSPARIPEETPVPKDAVALEDVLAVDNTTLVQPATPEAVLALNAAQAAPLAATMAVPRSSAVALPGLASKKHGGLPPLQPEELKSSASRDKMAVWVTWCNALKKLNGGIADSKAAHDRKLLNALLGYYAKDAKSENETFMRTVRKVYSAKDVMACINGLVDCGVHVTGAGAVAKLIDDFLDGDKPWPDVFWKPQKQRLPPAREEYLEGLRQRSREQNELAAQAWDYDSFIDVIGSR